MNFSMYFFTTFSVALSQTMAVVTVDLGGKCSYLGSDKSRTKRVADEQQQRKQQWWSAATVALGTDRSLLTPSCS
jgi:hypothetical protein